MKKLLLILSFIALPLQLKAQGLDDIITDRPDQSESAVTVTKGFIQVELGGTYEKVLSYDSPVGHGKFTQYAHSYPSVLLRYGAFKNVELRLAAEFLQDELSGVEYTRQNIKGVSPITVGAKFRLLDEKKARPETAVLVSLSLPVFDNAFKTQHLGAELRLAMANTLSERIGVSYNIGAEWDGEDNTKPTGLYTLALGIGLNKKLSMFAEIFGFVRNGTEPDHRLDGGFTYLVARNVQLDISGGYGITEISPDFFIGAGVSFRLPR